MCVIIDTNVLASVMISTSANHSEFKPVLDWILKGKGKIVYGGSDYLAEIAPKYLNLFQQFRTAGKAVLVDKESVDVKTNEAKSLIEHPDFDDPHMVGLLMASGCKIIVSLDERAYPFFRHNLFFRPARNRPKIYRSVRNQALLCDTNIAGVCLPCVATTNEQRSLLDA